jgi:hypothetical protein
MSLNSRDLDDAYALRRYDVQWRSLKAGALLALIVVGIALLV